MTRSDPQWHSAVLSIACSPVAFLVFDPRLIFPHQRRRHQRDLQFAVAGGGTAKAPNKDADKDELCQDQLLFAGRWPSTQSHYAKLKS
jgi:hypothetical protein